MHIAVNTRLLLPDRLDGIGWFSHEVLSRVTRDLPDVQFTFLFDRPFDERFIYHSNVKGKALFPPTRHPLLYRLYFDHVIPRALKKEKVDLFFSPDGFLSINTDVPQVPVIHDLNFEHRPEDLPSAYRKYYQSYFPRFAQKAERIITVSEYSKQDIIATYGIDQGKIDVAYNGKNEAYKPLSSDQKQKARERFALGERYFIFVGKFSSRKNIHSIIKAFDHFRSKHAESKLLLVGNPLWKYAEMEQALKNSKHESHVLFAGRLAIESLTQAMGAAEALIFPSYFEGFGIPMVEAFASGVPVITSNTSCLPEIGGDAASYVNPDSPEKISDAMQEIYFNGNQRVNLIEKGIKRAQHYSWNITANKVKNTLLNTLTHI